MSTTTLDGLKQTIRKSKNWHKRQHKESCSSLMKELRLYYLNFPKECLIVRFPGKLWLGLLVQFQRIYMVKEKLWTLISQNCGICSCHGRLWKRFCSEITTELGLLAENWKYLLAGIICQLFLRGSSTHHGLIGASLRGSLLRKAEEVKPYLNGRSMYLVGMMGSGKTTVGKLMAKVLGYSFYDCDTLTEQAMNESSTDALKKLSSMYQVIVSTGRGAVIRPINWKYMHKGISIWLDVPLEALAHRIATVGTDSRPLLHNESGDAYTGAFKRLSTIWDERGDAYTNANARVSLENIAVKRGYKDVSDLTPGEIAIKAFEQVQSFLGKEESMEIPDGDL
ncbi:unnamed protein product [Arabis nemorensis]|uniref:Shikimate kinase n=1 Tax=Arabis nemorensis TaxID=586526 RepID=A0A565BM83_9BRAS|nr:unnamed protein product [Arabis nemorensis]